MNNCITSRNVMGLSEYFQYWLKKDAKSTLSFVNNRSVFSVCLPEWKITYISTHVFFHMWLWVVCDHVANMRGCICCPETVHVNKANMWSIWKTRVNFMWPFCKESEHFYQGHNAHSKQQIDKSHDPDRDFRDILMSHIINHDPTNILVRLSQVRC